MKNIVVFFGSRSYEHDVSIITGIQTANNLNKFKFNITPIYIDKHGTWFVGEKLLSVESYKNFSQKGLKQVCVLPGKNVLYKVGKHSLRSLFEIDCAVVATHGGEGENGVLCGVLQASNIPKTCADHSACVVCMDKALTKSVLQFFKLPVLPGKVVKQNQKIDFEKLKYPLICKPANLGSSIGICVAKNKKELDDAFKVAFELDQTVLLEKCLTDFNEYNLALYKKDDAIVCSQIERPIKSDEILSFENKYIGSNKQSSSPVDLKREFPAKIDASLEKQIISLGKKAYEKLNLSGVVRIDFLFDNLNKKLFINEINTIPGSLAFYLFKQNKSFCELLDDLVFEAIKKEKSNKKNVSF